ncbi:MAG: DNA polymerase III subunit chi [Ramlibacter sp.]|nr:DNA polymerase III subunit chi [Ramlibacter sp.]
MTEVAFHFNAPDKLGYACRLLRKAVATGSRVMVTGQPDTLRELDVALWTFAPLEFLPHCYGDVTPVALAASPVVLSESVRSAPHHQVLLNLGREVPAGFESFERLIELVASDEEDRQLGRERWKHYTDRGYEIARYDMSASRA